MSTGYQAPLCCGSAAFADFLTFWNLSAQMVAEDDSATFIVLQGVAIQWDNTCLRLCTGNSLDRVQA